jgi:hypothetical protein
MATTSPSCACSTSKSTRATCKQVLRAEYEARSLSKRKPWVAEGISRRTWYRQRKQQTVSPPLAPAATAWTGVGSPGRYKIAADAMRPWTGTGSPGRYKLATQSGGTSPSPVFFLDRLEPNLCHVPAARQHIGR